MSNENASELPAEPEIGGPKLGVKEHWLCRNFGVACSTPKANTLDGSQPEAVINAISEKGSLLNNAADALKNTERRREIAAGL